MNLEDSAVVGDALRAARTQSLKVNKLPIAGPLSIESWPEAIPFEAAILIGDHGAAMSIMDQLLDDSHNLPEIERHIVQPALYGIRRKWQSNQITLVCEQMAAAIVKSVLIAAMLRSPASPQNGQRVLLGCAEGNDHDIELRIVADTFLIEGWEVRCLGASVPTQELLDQAITWRPDLLILSVSLMPQLLSANLTITQLNERLGSERPSVMISGLAISHYGRLASIIVGADSWSTDARGAIHCANSTKSKERSYAQGEPPRPTSVSINRMLSHSSSNLPYITA
jgi:methanogenic corrinoid protein MtbC1